MSEEAITEMAPVKVGIHMEIMMKVEGLASWLLGSVSLYRFFLKGNIFPFKKLNSNDHNL
jgi:hypothetical protein